MQDDWGKCIICGLPMEFRVVEDGICELRGFWSYPYLWVIAPIEAMFVEEFSFFIYKGSYLSALYLWMFGEFK